MKRLLLASALILASGMNVALADFHEGTESVGMQDSSNQVSMEIDASRTLDGSWTGASCRDGHGNLHTARCFTPYVARCTQPTSGQCTCSCYYKPH